MFKWSWKRGGGGGFPTKRLELRPEGGIFWIWPFLECSQSCRQVLLKCRWHLYFWGKFNWFLLEELRRKRWKSTFWWNRCPDSLGPFHCSQVIETGRKKSKEILKNRIRFNYNEKSHHLPNGRKGRLREDIPL